MREATLTPEEHARLAHTYASGGPLLRSKYALQKWAGSRPGLSILRQVIIAFLALIVVYGGAVAIVIAVLFGIDFLYRYFG
jgi:hypothetical protein